MAARLLVLLCLAGLALAGRGGGGDVTYDGSENVVILTPENFDAFIKSDEGVFVEFYAPWCGHCKTLKPIWEEAAGKKFARFGALDADKHGEFAQQFGVQGFPTIAFFKKGKKFEYDGDRAIEAFEAYATKMKAPTFVVAKDAAALTAATANKDSYVLGHFEDAESVPAKEFIESSNELFMSTSFILAQAAGAPSDLADKAIRVVKTGEDAENYSGALNSTDISAWVKGVSHPVLDELNQASFTSRVAGSTVGNFIFFYDPKDAQRNEALKEIVRSVAKNYKGKAQFFHINGVEFSDFAKNVDLEDKLPGLAVLDTQAQTHFVYSGDMTVEGLTKFVNSFLAKELVRELKSEPIPEADPEADVVVAVGKTFEALVADPEKDVLVEFYAPWCGHCKKLEPIWTKIGKYLKPVKSLVIAKINMDANDLSKDHNIEGFPTIRLFPAKDKTPIEYSGARNFKEIIKWLKKNASIPFELPKVTSKTEDKEL